jgi:3-methylcrotonyl-CoA carboxylase beta subunit
VRPRLLAPRFLFTWPNAKISVMGPNRLASVLATVRRDNVEAEGKTWTEEEEAAFKTPIRDKMEAEGSPYYATAASGTTASSCRAKRGACWAWR